MNTQPSVLKGSAEALKLLRLIAAHTGEKQYQILERLLRQELAKVAQERRP